MNAETATPRSQNPTFADLVDDYFSQYAGRDTSRTHRLAWWVAKFGARPATSITDDDIFIAMEELAAQPPRRYAGRDIDGRKIYRARGGKRSPATLNRYLVALAALFSWAIKRRRVAKGLENPCRHIEKNAESNGVVRFLSDDERARLLAACRESKWKRLYLLVLLAITTGARRGELLGLRWRDVDIERARASISTTKNGESKVLPLVPAVLAELQPIQGAPSALVFCSRVKPTVHYSFESVWQTALKAAKIHKFRFHDLRHTCASYLAQNGASLLEIADVMGHRQLAMTKRYAHLTVASKATLVNRVFGDIR
jgi:integrase